MVTFVKGLMRKFIQKKYLHQDGKSKEDDELSIDVLNKDKAKVLDDVVIGTKADLLFTQCSILQSEQSKKCRAECLRFFQISTQYLKDNLPLNVDIIKHAQCLHPEKRCHQFTTNTIANLSLKLTKALNGQLSSVFEIDGTREEIVDKIRFQWSQYQLEEITEDVFKTTRGSFEIICETTIILGLCTSRV